MGVYSYKYSVWEYGCVLLLLSDTLKMKVDSWVIFYPGEMRAKYPNVDVLWEQKASLGRVRRMNSETVTVYWEGLYGGIEHDEDVPDRFVRPAREVYFYEFWRRKGFHANLYGYAFAGIFFLLFVK